MLFINGWVFYFCDRNNVFAAKKIVNGHIYSDGWHRGYYWDIYWPYGIL